MMKLRKEIGAEAYNIHAIRHTVASEIGEAGDDADVMSITGHTTAAMVRHYAGKPARKHGLRRSRRKENDRKATETLQKA